MNTTDDTRAGEDSQLLSDDEFDALEDLLTSEAVPADCMNLEMLDGFLAATLASPVPVALERWLPNVWSAHEDTADFGSGSEAQRALRLVLRYHNELASTLGQPDGWHPFCYAAAEGDTLAIGAEWIEGFAQGLELWPQDWDSAVPAQSAETAGQLLEEMLAPWEADDAEEADDETRLQWLEAAAATIAAVLELWRKAGVPAPALLAVDAPAIPVRAAAGRNDPCPCGSGKKYKKCCGAN